jgi:outer membrane immunogenic protein
LPAGENGSPRVDGVFGGVQLGYNAQFGRVVAGVEGDLQIGSVKGSKTIDGPFGFYGGPGVATPAGVASTHLSMNTFGTLRARLGYTVTDNTLLYATGGLIVANIKTRSLFSTPNTNAVYESGSKTRTKAGWTAGAGIEHYFTHHLSGKVEALYYDLGSVVSYGYAPVNGQGYSHNQRFETRGALVRVGLNYKFGG